MPRTTLLLLCAAVAACGGNSAPSPVADNVQVSPENSAFLVGGNRISLVLLDTQQNPLAAGNVAMQVLDAAGRTTQRVTLSNVAAEYGGIATYIGVARFPDIGQYQLVVDATGTGGAPLHGHAFVTVSLHSHEVAVGARAPAVKQAVIGDPRVTIGMIDSGVPPDTWHTATVADGLAQHRPMVLYFGDPAYCPSKTCGPTRQILQQLCSRFCSSMLFEHIETYFPAAAPGPSAHVNPAFTAFGLQTDPWVYFVNAKGVVSDRYEGPVTLAALVDSATGTLAGKVPAVSLG